MDTLRIGRQELMKIIEDGNWALRVVWGPPIDVPLYGEENQDLKKMKTEPKSEVKSEVLKMEKQERNLDQSPITIEPEV